MPSRIVGFLIQEINKQHTLKLGNGLQEKTFMLHVQHFSESIVAIILRATQFEENPYLQFIEQHISPVLTTDLQGRIIHQKYYCYTIERAQSNGLDIFSLLESKYLNEFKLLFTKTIEGSAFGMPKCLLKGDLLSKSPFI